MPSNPSHDRGADMAIRNMSTSLKRVGLLDMTGMGIAM